MKPRWKVSPTMGESGSFIMSTTGGYRPSETNLMSLYRPAFLAALVAPMIIASSAAQMPSIWSGYLVSRLWVTERPCCGSQFADWISSSLMSG